MSMAIPSLNGTCPCRSCQRAVLRTPKQRALIKRAKLRGDLKLAARLAGKRLQ